ncbi:hypothetical protein [Thermocrispum municipale]|jgi:transposase-like protein|uniref:hypothetical protein n=1 Tax=Thermocrispum municipale TaxID=37926 RepID=UPI00041144B4|nr:hypothetical protein [Thermocrispum municipale]
MSERATPFYCPYCADEDLRPHVDDATGSHAAWLCTGCRRVFRVKMLGLNFADTREVVRS